MLNKLLIVGSYLMANLFSLYLFSNIKNIGAGEGVALSILFGSFLIGLLVFLLRLFISSSVFIKRSSMFLMLFYIYFVFRVVYDIGDIPWLKQLTIGTTAGTLLFYLLGVLFAVALNLITQTCLSNKKYINIATSFFVLYLIVSIFIFADALILLFARLREDVFLISHINGDYQRPGHFLIINNLLLSFTYLHIVFINRQEKSSAYKLLSPLFICAFLIYSAGAIIFSQAIHSNKATISIAGISILTVGVYVIMVFPKIKRHLQLIPFKLKTVFFGRFGRLLHKYLFLCVFLFIIILSGFVLYTGVDVSKTRIMGFGGVNTNSSVISRLQIWNNFPTQFNDSPILGNMNIDAETTGRGTYVHSFIGSILTHLGIIATFVFLIYLGLSIRELFSVGYIFGEQQANLAEKSIKIYSLMLFCVIFFIANISSFFAWIPLWFAMGLLFTPFTFSGKRNSRL
jgi:hypothetical protein